MAARADEAALCERFARMIYLYGRRHLRDDAAAKDLVQDVLVTVLQALRAGEVREPERLGSFVLGTCRFVVRNQRRTDARRRALLDANPIDEIDPTLPPRPFDRARLEDCMGKLSERDRNVVVLTFYADRSADEVADDLGTTRDNVRVVRHRAIARLADCVKGGEA